MTQCRWLLDFLSQSSPHLTHVIVPTFRLPPKLKKHHHKVVLFYKFVKTYCLIAVGTEVFLRTLVGLSVCSALPAATAAAAHERVTLFTSPALKAIVTGGRGFQSKSARNLIHIRGLHRGTGYLLQERWSTSRGRSSKHIRQRPRLRADTGHLRYRIGIQPGRPLARRQP